jgi:solute carrier family 25 protein 44
VLYLNIMEFVKAHLVDFGLGDSSSPAVSFCAAGMASLATQTVGVPVDVVTQRIMAKQGPRNAVSIAGDLFQAEGVRGFYRGYTASLAMYASQSAMQWFTYSWLRQTLRNDLLPSSPLKSFKLVGAWNAHEAAITAASGFVAGSISAFLITPLDVLRTRQQVDETRMYYTETFRNVVKEGGLQGFWKGAYARAMSSGPSSLLLFSAYEVLKQVSRRQSRDS